MSSWAPPTQSFGAFSLKTTFVVRMNMKSSKQKVQSHSCFLALAQVSPGRLIPPVTHGKTDTAVSENPWLHVSQSAEKIKGSSDTGPHGEGCLPRQFCPGGWDKTRERAGAGRGSHRELTGQQLCSPGVQPCALTEPRSPASGAPLQRDGTQQSNTMRPAPGEGPGHTCCPGSLAPGSGAGTPERYLGKHMA